MMPAPPPRRPPDLVIVDLGHHDPDSIEVIRRLQGWTKAPIIRAGCSPSQAWAIAFSQVRRGNARDQPTNIRQILPTARSTAPTKDREVVQRPGCPPRYDLAPDSVTGTCTDDKINVA